MSRSSENYLEKRGQDTLLVKLNNLKNRLIQLNQNMIIINSTMIIIFYFKKVNFLYAEGSSFVGEF